ncbi:MAG: hypothetical protein K2Y21_06175 [Phycisphaerales bacterium]|nr:hypothetical protein [Phycisphaerales bacterium]
MINPRQDWRSRGIGAVVGMSLVPWALAQTFPAFTVQSIANPDGATYVLRDGYASLADNADAGMNYVRAGSGLWTHGYVVRNGSATALTPVSDATVTNHPLGRSSRVFGITPGGTVFGASGPCGGAFSQNNHASVYWSIAGLPVSVIDPTLPNGSDRRVGCAVVAMNDRLMGAMNIPSSSGAVTRSFVGNQSTSGTGIVQASCAPNPGLATLAAVRINRQGVFGGNGSCGSFGTVGSLWTIGGSVLVQQAGMVVADLDDNGRYVGNDPATVGPDLWTNGVRSSLTSNTTFSPLSMNKRGDVVASGGDQIILGGTLYSHTQATGLLPPGYVRVSFLDVNDRGQVLVAFIQAPGNTNDPSIAAILTPAPAPNVVRNPGFDGSFSGWRPWSPRFPASGPPLAGFFPMPFGPVGNTGAKIDSGNGAAISQYVDLAPTPSRVRLTIYAATPGGTVTVALGSTVIGSVDTAMLPAGAGSVKLVPIPPGMLGQQGVNLDIAYAGADGFSVLVDDVGIESYCPGDLNADTTVDDTDFVIFAEAYNRLDCADPMMPAGCPADLNADGFVDDADFVLFAEAYNALLCP